MIPLHKYILGNKLFTKLDSLIVAVSGGVDSMVLLHILHSNGFKVTAAHCNFQLRGVDSDSEMNLINDYCSQNQIPFLLKIADAKSYADEKKVSIQMAAREIRYDWFTQLVESTDAKFVLTAHHLQDQVETFFINLIRGTGINGLKGIPSKNNFIRRPFLEADKNSILDYANKHKVPYLNDKSNIETKYLRNKIRLDLLPILRSINPSLDQTIQREMKIFEELNEFLKYYLSLEKSKCVNEKEGIYWVDKSLIAGNKLSKLLLHHIFSEFGFDPDTIDQIELSINTQSGKIFYSKDYFVVSDRKFWIVKSGSKVESSDQEKYLLKDKLFLQSKKFIVDTFSGAHYFNQHDKISLDADKIDAPLNLGKFRKGDRFFPIGMTGSKKLSDFFVSKKMSLLEKEDQLILRCGDEVVWIVGKRMDRRYCVSESTVKTIVITIENA